MARRTIGVFQWRQDWADLWVSQCDGPFGRHRDVELRPFDARADHVLLIGPPVSPSGHPRLPYLQKKRAKLAGRYDAERLRHAVGLLGRSRDDLTMLVYEPACAFTDAWFETARELCSRVYAPDARGTHPTRLPATWSFPDRLGALRDEPPAPDRPIDLACITSGKRLWPGHDERLDFLRAVRAAGVPMDLFGRALPSDLAPRGPVLSKATVYRAARFALVLENDTAGDLYVTEKLWDALICWTLPIYYGSGAADHVAPAGSFIRLPDLGPAGLECVREALANPGLWDERRDAIAEARRRALHELNLVEWIPNHVGV